nr:unnamed protein product [Digitaria exilis]
MPTTLGPLICSGASFLNLTVSTPLSSLAATESRSAFSGSLNWRQNLPYERSSRCQWSPLLSSARRRSPLTRRTRLSSTSILRSSLRIPGTSTTISCASGVSRQSTRAIDTIATSSRSKPKGTCSRILNGSARRPISDSGDTAAAAEASSRPRRPSPNHGSSAPSATAAAAAIITARHANADAALFDIIAGRSEKKKIS